MFHRSQRLLMRPIWSEDWEGILSGIADKQIVRNLATAPWPYREEDARHFASLPIHPNEPRFVITRAADAQVLGCIGVKFNDDDDLGEAPVAELGYWIARAHWGHGYATEAGRAVLEIARTLGHRKIHGSHFVDNPASGRVLQKLGFVSTGRRLMRQSCARGEAAPMLEYALDLHQSMPIEQSARQAA